MLRQSRKVSSCKVAVVAALFASTVLPWQMAEAQENTLTNEQVASVISRIRSTSATQIKLADAVVLGQLLITQKRFGEAYELFNAVREKNPGDLTAVYGAGLAAFNLGNSVEAEKLARVAVKVAAPAGKELRTSEERARAADALVLLAVVLAVRGNDSESLQRAQEAANAAPDRFDAQFTLGRALYSAGDMTRAAEAFRKAIALKPGDTQSTFFLGTTLEHTGDVAGAISCYRQLIAQQPDAAQGHLGLGILLVRDNGEQFEEGIAELKRSIDIDPNSYEGRVALGRALIVRGRLSESIPHLLAAAQLEPGNPEPHFQLSLAYRRLGMKDKSADEAALVKQIHANRRAPNGRAQTTP